MMWLVFPKLKAPDELMYITTMGRGSVITMSTIRDCC